MRKFAFWLAFIVVTVTGQAVALEVGGIQVRSFLNEPLVASIPVQVGSIQERNSLAATIAPETEYVARGLQPLARPDDLVVQVTEGGGLEQMLIELRSLSEINEPFMSLVLQLVWDGGSEVREFTVLLDPAPVQAEAEEPKAEPMGLAPAEPESDDSRAALEAFAAEIANEPGVSVNGPKPQVVIRKVHPDDYLSGKASAPSFTGDRYGPVAAGETLWRIATMVRPSNRVSMAKVMEAIFQANPSAFAGSYNTLKKGAMLSIPSEEVMRGTSAPAATATAPSEAPAADESTTTGTESEGASPGIWMSQDQRAKNVDAQQLESKGGLITKSAQAPAVAEDQEAEAPQETEAAPQAASPATVQEAPVEAAPDSEAAAPVSQVDEGRVAYDSEGSDQPATEELAVAEPEAVVADEPETTEEPAVPEPVVPVSDESADGTDAGGNTNILAAVILVVLVLTYLWYRRRRSVEGPEEPVSYASETDEMAEFTPDPLADEPDQIVSDQVADAQPEIAEIEDVLEEEAAPQAMEDESIAQADTYLSYGLYESAAEVLQKGIADNPQRSDLRMKLLETYETSGNSEEFVAAANDWESSSAELTDVDRERVIALGARVAPGVGLFGAAAMAVDSSEQTAEELDAGPAPAEENDSATEELPELEFDLDQPAAETGDVEGSELEVPAAEPTMESEADSVALDLDTGLDTALESEPAEDEIIEDLGLPEDMDLGEAKIEQPAEAETTESLEFDLGELELDEPASTEAELAQPAEEAETPDAGLDFDLDDSLTVDETEAPDSETSATDLSLELDDGLSLEEPTPDETPAAAEAPVAADESEYDVKIDLAQAYLDMGEPDLAKGLLDEVMEGGNETQKATAQKLLGDIA